MEEYNDVAMGPNEDGSFNLCHDDMHAIPYNLCTDFNDNLLYLNLSYNKIVEITAEICNLTLLKEMNLSHNCLKRIDPGIGRCIRLRKVDLSFNNLVILPTEMITECKLLDSISLNNNSLEAVPIEMCNLQALECLDLRHNNIEALPLGLHKIRSLKQILCQGNEKMDMITPSMRNSSDLVLWTLKIHQTFQDQISEARKEYDEVETLAIKYLTEAVSSNEAMLKQKQSLMQVEKDRPVEYLVRKEKIQRWLHRWIMRVKSVVSKMITK